jgi:hypothetical protein
VTDDPQLGRVLAGRYRIDELIGRGGMSTVYRAFDTRLQRSVAIKIFEPSDDDEARWESEIRLLSQLSDPHLVTLHDAHLEPRGSVAPSYLVMEYVAGSSLQQHLAEAGPSGPLAALIVAEIGEALAAVHLRGIVHRDVKPANILLEPSDVPPLRIRTKLADFGIAHLLGDDRITRTGTIIGTAAYTSPEQVRGEQATTSSDLYSLGLVAIETLTGRSPFAGTPAETLVARLSRDPELPAGLPGEWSDLLRAMTANDPSRRPTAIAAALTARHIESELAAGGPRLPGEPEGDAPPPTEAMLAPTLVLPASGATALMPPAADGPTAREIRRPSLRRAGARSRVFVAASAKRWAVALAVIAALAILVIAVLSTAPTRATPPAETPSATPHTSIVPSPATTATPAPVKQKPGKGSTKKKG